MATYCVPSTIYVMAVEEIWPPVVACHRGAPLWALLWASGAQKYPSQTASEQNIGGGGQNPAIRDVVHFESPRFFSGVRVESDDLAVAGHVRPGVDVGPPDGLHGGLGRSAEVILAFVVDRR